MTRVALVERRAAAWLSPGGRGCRALCALVALAAACGCSETLDAGHDVPYGMLPVDQRNPLVLINDGAYDNWSGEYAVLLAADGGPPLAGIVVNAAHEQPDIVANVGGYRDLIAAARASGIENLPDPLVSVEVPLVAPASGKTDDTVPNRSEGARFIVEVSKRLAEPYRPIVLATGGALTDVADAYLLDHAVADRVVVVASLGSVSTEGGSMGIPNGDRDTWADKIVAEHFRYVQVSVFYDQLTDVPNSSLAELPNTELGAWIRAKQPNLYTWQPAADQVAVLAAGIPAFATAVDRVSPSGAAGTADSNGPELARDPGGSGWLVTGCDSAAATSRFWTALRATKSSMLPASATAAP
jgi:hypothetical protein